MPEIALSRGQIALVDDADFERLSSMAWHFNQNGYAVHTNNDGTKVLMHRLIVGAQSDQIVDHVNGSRLDNRRSNLRIATHAQNLHNSRPRGRSRFKGVAYDKANRRWKFNVQHNGKRHQGYRSTEIEAAHARDVLARELQGEFAYLNFPDSI